MGDLWQHQVDALDALDEVWRDVIGYEGLYQVSDHGRVKSLGRTIFAMNRWGSIGERKFPPKIIVQTLVDANYARRLEVKIGDPNGKWKTRLVHQLVAEAFIGPRPLGKEVAHNDGNSLNNKALNLRYATPLENTHDKYAHGTMVRGSDSATAKLTDAQVIAMRENADNLSGGELAKRYEISQAQVSRIRNRSRWGHVA